MIFPFLKVVYLIEMEKKKLFQQLDIDFYGCQNRQDLPCVCAAIQEPLMQCHVYVHNKISTLGQSHMLH